MNYARFEKVLSIALFMTGMTALSITLGVLTGVAMVKAFSLVVP